MIFYDPILIDCYYSQSKNRFKIITTFLYLLTNDMYIEIVFLTFQDNNQIFNFK